MTNEDAVRQKHRFTEDDKRLRFLPEKEAVIPPADLIRHEKDCWWLVHPAKGLLIFVGSNGRLYSPQANANKAIVESLHWMAPWAEIKFFPSVFYRINPQDYCGHTNE